MEEVVINYWAVIVAALIYMVVGMLWYGPLFGKPWMAALGIKKEDIKKEDGMKGMALSLVGALLGAYVLAHIVQYAEVTTAVNGALTGFWVWLGFLSVNLVANGFYESKKFVVTAIYSSYQLVTILIAGALLAVWV